MREETVPVYDDPLLPIRYTWQTRRDSVVKVEIWVPLYEQGVVPITLKIQRGLLAVLLNEGQLEYDEGSYDGALLRFLELHKDLQDRVRDSTPSQIRWYFFCRQFAFRLKVLSDDGPPRREKLLSIALLPGARFTVAKSRMPFLRNFFSSPAPEGWTHVGWLAGVLEGFLLSSLTLLQRIIRPAKGREFKKQVLLDLLPRAYGVCNALVVRAKKDEEISEEISKLLAILLKTDERARVYLEKLQGDESWDRGVAPCLVFWGFYGAWEKFNVAPLRTPEDLLRQYVYGENAERMKRAMSLNKQIDPTIDDEVFERAKELYLRERGAAAKAYKLI